MANQHESTQRLVLLGAVLVAYVALLYFGVNYLQSIGRTLIYELAYGLFVTIAFAVVGDRLFVR